MPYSGKSKGFGSTFKDPDFKKKIKMAQGEVRPKFEFKK